VTARQSRRIGAVAFYAAASLLAVMFMFPFFWTAASSLKAPNELFAFPPTWLPAEPQWANYGTVLRRVPFGTWFANSLFVVVVGTAGTLISCTLVAYSFARFRYHGREAFFVLTLGTVMLPAEVTLVPRYLIFRELGWLDTLRPLWVPDFLAGSAFSVFLIRQFILSIPRDLDEAAIVDGASYVRILTSILVPLLKPVLATVAVIHAVSSWNEFLGPLIFLNTPENYTLAVGLRYFNQSPGESGRPQQHLLMAAAVMSIAPCIVLFFAAQRYFVRGIVTSGIKG
jgi:multiple sugar transport system permease protein